LQVPRHSARRTKERVKPLKPGDLAVIHHADLDGAAAESLVERKAAAVINASHSVSGRYANRGPSILIGAGIPLLDEVGDGFFEHALKWEGLPAVLEGESIRVVDG